jgi:hypothetical protein
MPGINGRFSMYDLRCPRFTSSIFCFSISGFFESHDKEEEKMRNIEYGIACARPAPTSPIIPIPVHSEGRKEVAISSDARVYRIELTVKVWPFFCCAAS